MTATDEFDGLVAQGRAGLAAGGEDQARHGAEPGWEDQEAYGEALLEDALAAAAARRLAAGEPARSRPDEDDVRRAVRDDVFGAGVLQPFLSGEFSDVLVSSELLVLVDARTGLKEYRPSPLRSGEAAVEWGRQRPQPHARAPPFDPAPPRINLPLPDGTRLPAVMAFTRRCHIALRPHPRLL